MVRVKIKPMKEKALRKHSLHGKIEASVLLKLFVSDNERCHTTTPLAQEHKSIFKNVNNIQSIIPEDQKSITKQ